MGRKANKEGKLSQKEEELVEEKEREEKEEEEEERDEDDVTMKKKKKTTKTKTPKKTKKMTKRELMEHLKASLMQSAAKLLEEERIQSSKKKREEKEQEKEKEEEEEAEEAEEEEEEETGDEQSESGSDDEGDEVEFISLGKKKRDERKKVKPRKEIHGVVYIGHLPHGFYEEQLVEFFSQFGKVVRARVSRTKKGFSRHFGYLQFEDPDVAPIAVSAMNGYMMFNHVLRCSCVPPEDLHPGTFRGAFVAGSKKQPFRGVKSLERTAVPRDEKKRAAWESRRLKRARETASKLQTLGIEIEHPLLSEMEKRKKRKTISGEEENAKKRKEDGEEMQEEDVDEEEEEKDDDDDGEEVVEKEVTPKKRYGLRRNRKPAQRFTPEKRETEAVANKEKTKKKKGTPTPKKTPRHRRK
eukprot:TRINITY_DN234_c0_g6_i1.p2 TRINITY_DN234_c0_g6~~TRINITY_DN234_c0_g6_i1.p2  ORF type:complete len:412 (+),score=222.80 TRINITY_DN234_c0_g6_i1:162-1397(+)